MCDMEMIVKQKHKKSSLNCSLNGLPAPKCRSVFFLFDKRCFSYLSYLFINSLKILSNSYCQSGEGFEKQLFLGWHLYGSIERTG